MEFDWDDGNRNKNLRHGVHDWEIEEALLDPFRCPGPEHREGDERRAVLAPLCDLGAVPQDRLHYSYKAW